MGFGRASQSWLLPAAFFVTAACGAASEKTGGDEAGDSLGSAAGEGAQADGRVLPGIEVLLRDSLHLVRGLRVGLITNHTGFDRQGLPSIDRLAESPDVNLVALFSPEHGIRGTIRGGDAIDDDTDRGTGLPIHSLYGETRKPTPEMLEGIDVLLFDIQDVGARYYTYVSTMALGMEAAGEAGVPFVVLDRPNPIGGTHVQGNILDPAFSTFVGMFPTPMRHGMTPGELARLYRGEFGVAVDLHVVPMEGWRREMLYPETGIPWVPLSPNMPSVESALHYPGTCLFEGTNLSLGRGTEIPFQWIGAPWLDGELLAARLNAYGLDGVRFEAVAFTPDAGARQIFSGTEVYGVRFVALDDSYDPTGAAVAALLESRRMSGDRWEWRESHFDRLAGTDALRQGIDRDLELDALLEGWDEDRAAFLELRERYLIYR